MLKKYGLLCLLSVLCLSTTCDEDTFNEMTGITVSVIDNSGDKFRMADDGQCPKEALILQITPKWNATGYIMASIEFRSERNRRRIHMRLRVSERKSKSSRRVLEAIISTAGKMRLFDSLRSS